MSQTKQIAETYASRIWDKKDLSAIDDLVSPMIVIHSLLGDFHGPDALKQVVVAWQEGFPDLSVNNISVISEKDLTVIHWKAEGTHLGTFKGVPSTKKTVSYAGVTIYRIQEGKITEYWAYLDMKHLLKQIS